MNKHKNFVKFVKKIYLTINRLIENNLNKLNLKNFSKIIRSHKFFLSSCALIILFFSYLLVPNFYDKIELVEKLENKLQNKLFGIECNYEELNGIDFKKAVMLGKKILLELNLKISFQKDYCQ